MPTGSLVEQCGFCYNLTRGFHIFCTLQEAAGESAAVTTKVAVRPLSTRGSGRMHASLEEFEMIQKLGNAIYSVLGIKNSVVYNNID